MAHRTHHPVDASKSDVKIIYASAIGAGVGALTDKGGDLLSATRTGAGVHTLKFRHKYPRRVTYNVKIVGATAGLEGKFSAWDPVAGTATLTLHVGGVATDAATTDTILIEMHVRNTKAND